MNLKKFWKLVLVCVLFVGPILAQAETVWIDVRSLVEYKLDHIKGDLRISHTEIVEEVGKLFTDKDTEIYLYCRSGGRAGKAKSALNNAGYKNVFNLGGIEDARKKRRLIESSTQAPENL